MTWLGKIFLQTTKNNIVVINDEKKNITTTLPVKVLIIELNHQKPISITGSVEKSSSKVGVKPKI